MRFSRLIALVVLLQVGACHSVYIDGSTGTKTASVPSSPTGPTTTPTDTTTKSCTGNDWCIEGYTEMNDTFEIIAGVDIRKWASTATITGGTWAGGYAISFDKKSVWKEQYGGPGISSTDPILFTIWAFVEKPTGGWVGSGFIQVWPTRTDAGGSGSPCYQLPTNWWYPDGPWGAMRQYPFGAGKRIAIVVTSGNTRLNGNPDFKERSSVAIVRLPSTC